MSGRLVILDRDGVINHDSPDYIKSPAEWQPIAGSIEAIVRLSQAGFVVAVASNQSGIGRKLIDPPALEAIHDKLRQAVRDAGGHLGRIVFCPHHPDDGCECRKPAPGLLLALGRQYGVSLTNLPMVGDSLRDVDAAIAVGGRPILVLTGNGTATRQQLDKQGRAVETYPDLAQVADLLIGELRDRK
jgi:D-glycero-D-manno-heptose 1,7-bisphosphate phosphatase